MRFVKLTRAAAAAVVAIVCASCSDGSGVTPVSGLRFIQQPADIRAGQPFTVSVELLDGSGGRVSSNNQVTISTSTGGVTGTSTVAADDGVATFTGISVTQAGTGIQLSATSGNISATSVSFTVTPAPVSADRSTISPSGALAAFADNVLEFTFRDEFNNPIPLVPVMISSNITPSTFSPASGTTSEAGIFETIFQPGAIGTATFSATVDGQSIVFASTSPVQDVCPLAPLPFPGNVTGSLPNGACIINGFPSASHRFTTSNEFVARFTVSAAFSPAFEISSDPPVDNVVLRSSTPPLTAEWLLPAGTYNARVGASLGSGQYNIVGLVGLNEDECPLRFLAVAGTYTSQQLQPGDCNTDDFDFFTEPDGSRADFFAIHSARPCTITMRSSVMDSFLVIVDWDSFGPLAGDNDSGGGVNGQDATISLTSCTSPTGPLVIVTNHIVPVVGPYTLTISFDDPVAAGASATREVEVRHSNDLRARRQLRSADRRAAIRK